MQHISSLIGNGQKFNDFIARGKKVKQWFLGNGYIYTNFGWLHKDWISEGFKLKAIASSGPSPIYEGQYKVVVTIRESWTHEREGREVKEKKSEKYDLTNFNNWLKFLELKRSTTFVPSFIETKPEQVAMIEEPPLPEEPYYNGEGEPTPF